MRMDNKSLVTKQDIAKYVQDMAEIEAAEFTLRKAAEEMRSAAETTRRNNSDAVKKCEDQLKHYTDVQVKEKQQFGRKQEFERPTPPPPMWDPPTKPDCWDEYQRKQLHGKKLEEPKKGGWTYNVIQIGIGLVITYIINMGILLVSLLLGINEIMDMSEYGGSLLVIVIFAVYILASFPIFHHKKKRDYKEAVANYNHDLNIQSIGDAYLEEEKMYNQAKKQNEELTKKYRRLCDQHDALVSFEREKEEEIIARDNQILRAKEDVARAIKKQAKDEIRMQYVCAQANLLVRRADELHSKKESLYKVNIIPPDYRALDCVIMFHQIFRNDLADTMREAVKIYEERVFRQEVIRGIDKIYQMLGHLSASMSLIENRLVQIRDEVRFMSNDIYQISEKLSDISSSQRSLADSARQQNQTSIQLNQTLYAQQRTQEKQLAETRASRYATEALKNATDQLVWYEQQNYWNRT